MDCFEGMKKIDNDSIDLVLTDPPYGVAYKTGRRIQQDHDFCFEIANDKNIKWAVPVINEINRVLKDNSAIYWFTNHDAIEKIKPLLDNVFAYKNTITWVKNNWTAGDLDAQYGKQTELIVYLNKGRRFINGKRETDVWYHNRVAGKNQCHQNEKPVDLIQYILVKSSNENDLILDPFMGSGTTAVACIRTNRNFIGFEINQDYVNIANKRIKYERSQLKLNL